MGELTSQRRSCARARPAVWSGLAAVAIPLFLIAPALWNGYPLLQWDTGGYLARWYEGYLVPSRSTVFGLYLHFGEDFGSGSISAVQALATLWILQLTLARARPDAAVALLAISLALILTTALPWLASMLLTDIFAGLSVLSLFILVAAWRADFGRSKNSCCSSSPPLPPRPIAPRSACCSGSAASAGSRGRCCARRSPSPDSLQGSLDHRRGRRDAAVGKLRAVGTIRLDARRLRRRLRTHDAGWHRRAISERPLPAARS